MSDRGFGFVLRGTRFSSPRAEPALYCVATPIGNLGDITLRALDILAGCAVIACEDTRTSGVLLSRYAIDTPRLSYTEHNADARGAQLLARIGGGEAVALISDAGTPLVSDPGHRLVHEAIARGIAVVPVPGASAPVNALVGSGFGAEPFTFHGFLPGKAQARGAVFQSLVADTGTHAFFESPNRLLAVLREAREIFGPAQRAVVARELTKMHETFHRGTLDALLEEFSALERIRGEIVLLLEIEPEAAPDDAAVDAMLIDALATMKTKDAARAVAEKSGLPRTRLYDRALELKRDG